MASYLPAMVMLATSIDRVQVTVALDPYLSLRSAASYTGLSVRTLRGWLTNPERPLPCYRVNGKILLRRSDLDHWLAGFRHVGKSEIDRLVDGILGDLRAESNTQSGGQSPRAKARSGTTGTRGKTVAGELRNGCQL